jgi:cyclophilin family peptidyl-prolyl cis-trans isomerase
MKQFIMKVLSVVVLAVMIAACSSPLYFRTITKDEGTAIKQYRKQIKQNDQYHVLIMTNMGNMVVKLYNETPLHRDNFISKVKAGFYDSLMFHRVIKDFMIQGGDPNSKNPQAGQPLGAGSAPGAKIPAELKTDLNIYHKRGALAAARSDNPEKASSNCQFYIVHHKAWRITELDSAIVSRRLNLNETQKKLYTTQGGTPHLDGSYTVYGELETGFEVLDKIATTKTQRGDRPEQDVRMRMFIIAEPKTKK